MAPYSEQPGLEVGTRPNDKYMPGALLQGYSTAAMAHTSTNFHPATEGHALHLANEGNSNGENPFSNSAQTTPYLNPVAEGYTSPSYSSPHSAQASSISHSTAGRTSTSNYSFSHTPQTPSVVPPAPERNSPSGYASSYLTHTTPVSQPTANRQSPSDFSRSNSAGSANQLQKPQHIAAGYASSNISGLPGPYKSYEDREKEKTGRTICGLGLATFLWLLALAIVILVAGIGGGVGGTIAVSNAKKEAAVAMASASAANLKQNSSPTSSIQTPTSTPTSITSVITSVITSNIRASTSATPTTTSSSATFTADPSPSFIPLDCTSPRKFTIGSTYENIFNVTCNQDFTPPVIGGNNDIIALTVYSVSDCLRACASYNRNIGGGNQCKGAAFDANWAAVNKDSGNCWLKNTTSVIKSGSNTQAVILLQT